MTSRFIFNETLWSELLERVYNADHVDAAIAYFGEAAPVFYRYGGETASLLT